MSELFWFGQPPSCGAAGCCWNINAILQTGSRNGKKNCQVVPHCIPHNLDLSCAHTWFPLSSFMLGLGAAAAWKGLGCSAKGFFAPWVWGCPWAWPRLGWIRLSRLTRLLCSPKRLSTALFPFLLTAPWLWKLEYYLEVKQIKDFCFPQDNNEGRIKLGEQENYV